MREEGDAAYQVETQHDDQVSATGVKRLPAVLTCRCCSQNDIQDPHVGEDDERNVYAHKADDDSEAHGAVFLSVVTGQTDQRHVVAVAVMDLVGAAEPQWTCQTNQCRHDGDAAHQSEN